MKPKNKTSILKSGFLLMYASFILFSCNDDDGYARFDRKEYAIHHDESVQLRLISSEDTERFEYFTNATNVVSVSPTGLARGLYVGEARVIAKYGDLSAGCTVEVTPYENLFRMLPLLGPGLNRNAIKWMEKAIERDTLPAPMNLLLIDTTQEDPALKTMEYSFVDDGLVSISAYLKDNTAIEKINRFMRERYPYKEGTGYEDFGSGAKVRYVSEDNRIEYSW